MASRKSTTNKTSYLETANMLVTLCGDGGLLENISDDHKENISLWQESYQKKKDTPRKGKDANADIRPAVVEEILNFHGEGTPVAYQLKDWLPKLESCKNNGVTTSNKLLAILKPVSNWVDEDPTKTVTGQPLQKYKYKNVTYFGVPNALTSAELEEQAKADE